ncbi:MAG TPA: type II toxin-antitoxin system HicB family antitoxin [Anaerolineales bacterium]|nr:type II toxin-antitoxin system HicB family antitoxin [Anaerolineales bacterium]
MKFKVVLEPSEDGGFTAFVPSLPGCVSEGESQEDALSTIQEAIALYLEPVEDDLLFDEKAQVREIEL